MENRYHHGNLKNALIEAGIQLITEKGEDGLSLRKVASMCGVSQAAPYSHFAGKEDLIHGMQQYITQQFMVILEQAVMDMEIGSREAIIEMGVAYVNFFIEHPQYFKFMFFTPYLPIVLSPELGEDAYPPYALFHKYAVAALKKMQCSEEELLPELTNMWASVQGITLIATSSNVRYDGDIKSDIRRILTNGEKGK